MAQNPAVPTTIPLDNVTSSIQQLLDPSFAASRPPRGFLPDYIRGLPPRLQAEDIDYLSRKGALTIPDVGLRNELLKSYIHYVHTYMPLLDLEDFLQTIARNDGIHRMSLLLFQAVMFAGTAFIDLKHLRAAGFQTRKAARKVFFQRARVCSTSMVHARTPGVKWLTDIFSCCTISTMKLIGYRSFKLFFL